MVDGEGTLMDSGERPAGQAGTSMVELSIVLTLVFLPLIYGLITFGYAFSIRENMTHAAQEALRQAVINAQTGQYADTTSPTQQGYGCMAVNDARNRMAGSIGSHRFPSTTDPCGTAVNAAGGLDISTDYGLCPDPANSPIPTTSTLPTTTTTAPPPTTTLIPPVVTTSTSTPSATTTPGGAPTAGGTCMDITMVYQYHSFPIIAPLPGIFDLLPRTLKVTATERVG